VAKSCECEVNPVKHRIVGVSLLLMICAVLPVKAQSNDPVCCNYFPIPSDCVCSPTKVLEVALSQPPQKEYTLGADIDLGQPKSMTTLPPDFHVRVFSGALTELKSQGSAAADPEVCIPFPSVVLSAVLKNGKLLLPGIVDSDWLAPLVSGFGPRDYSFVFEQGDSRVNQVFALPAGKIAEYFKHAYQFTLKPPDGMTTGLIHEVEAVAARAADTAAKFAGMILSNPSFANSAHCAKLTLPNSAEDSMNASNGFFVAAVVTACSGAPEKLSTDTKAADSGQDSGDQDISSWRRR
jgi:hypothetical protein